jgi:hypothetical protein
MTSLNPVAPVEEAAVQTAAAIEIPDRYELKYLISESQVEAVRRAIQPYCVLDPHSERQPDHQYGIQSLYLDTPNLDLYRISRERRAQRWKARIRRYDDSERVFFEIKNKDHSLIKKQRARVPSDGWAERIHRVPDADVSPAERYFLERVERYNLVPTLMVRYLREAWISTVDSYARVTFDRRIVCQPYQDWSLEVDDVSWLALDSSRSMLTIPCGVVLELKCLTAVPRWLSNVVHSVGLARASYSKYCKGVERLFARDTLLGVLNQT